MTTRSGKFVGIDVAKEKLDIAVLGEKKASQVANEEKGIAKLIEQMQALAPELIVVEATGGYQREWSWECTRQDCRWQWSIRAE